MLNKLRDMLKRHEGERPYPYRCTAGKLTIGYGRNLDDKGLSAKEMEYLLDSDIAEVLGGLNLSLPCWDELSDVRKEELADMCLNLGLAGFLKFKRMIRALEDRNYKRAAKEMLDSRWASQVGRRANELAFMMREGEYQEGDEA